MPIYFIHPVNRPHVHDTSSSFSVRPQTVEVKRSTDTSSECRKKNIPQQKICDMFLLFFGLIGGSTHAVDRIFISTAWNKFIYWALIVVSAIEHNLCAIWFFANFRPCSFSLRL